MSTTLDTLEATLPTHRPRFSYATDASSMDTFREARLPSASSLQSPDLDEARGLWDPRLFAQMVDWIRFRNYFVHGVLVQTIIDDPEDRSAESFADELVSRILTAQENGLAGIDGGVASIKHTRTVLFSETLDLSNLPKRRRVIPSLGPSATTDDE